MFYCCNIFLQIDLRNERQDMKMTNTTPSINNPPLHGNFTNSFHSEGYGNYVKMAGECSLFTENQRYCVSDRACLSCFINANFYLTGVGTHCSVVYLVVVLEGDFWCEVDGGFNFLDRQVRITNTDTLKVKPILMTSRMFRRDSRWTFSRYSF